MSSGIRAAVRRAVVIDNDDLLASAIESLLSDDGWSAQRFTSLKAAEPAFERMPDLLILDLLLEGHSGTELLAQLACRADAPPTVVISAAQDLARVAARYGVVTLRKPFELDRLMAAVDTATTDGRRPSLRAANG